jgi:hypothetical protein
VSPTPAVEDFKRIVDSLKVPVALVDGAGANVYGNPPFA